MDKIKNIIDLLKTWAKANPNKAIFAAGFCVGFLVGRFIL
jgi:hypothetical protein